MDETTPEPEHCKVCTKPVTVMIRKGSGICGDNCQQVQEARDG
jgi:predicted nucleic acid-binding Zn ribbon protein